MMERKESEAKLEEEGYGEEKGERSEKLGRRRLWQREDLAAMRRLWRRLKNDRERAFLLLNEGKSENPAR